MTIKIDEVLIRRKNKLTISGKEITDFKCADKTVIAYVIAIQKNIESLGYTFNRHVFATLCGYTTQELEMFNSELLPLVKSLCGADVEYNPMYKNFPRQVAEMNDVELYINAIVHYITDGEYLPSYAKVERLPFIDGCKPSKFADNNGRKMSILSIGKESDVMELFANLVASKTSISEQDKRDIAHIVTNYPNYVKHMPDEIPFKENVAYVTALLLDADAKNTYSAIKKYFKTATDVLRLAVALCGGDVSLTKATHFKSFKRSQRRLMMNLLANIAATNNILEDMYRHPSEWIHLGEWVHPCEPKSFSSKRFDNVRSAFETLRNEKKPVLFMTKVEEGTKQGKMKEVAELLKTRPGDFARRLDKLIRDSNSAYERNMIINAFACVAEKVSTPVLLQVRQHFAIRMKENDKYRIFFPKGNTAKVVCIKNNMNDISDNCAKNIISICYNALLANYAKRDYLGNVYIDPELKGFVTPFSQRSATAGNKIVVRGSRIKVNYAAKVIRGFIWWTNTDNNKTEYSKGRVDLDLSAVMLDENFNEVEHVSYTRLRSGEMGSYHSGDIVNGGSVQGKGAAEFIDFNLEFVRKKARYVCFTVNSFTRQKFSELPNCRFGWMERENVDSGEIFEPATVDMAIKPTCDGTMIIPVLFDTLNREFIWMDITSTQSAFSRYRPNNVENNMEGIRATCYAMANIKKSNLYDVISLNAKARGIQVVDREHADIIFSNDTTIPMETIIEEDPFMTMAEFKVGEHEQKEVKREKQNVKIVTAYDIDYIVGQLI